jgi:hypothetical protein
MRDHACSAPLALNDERYLDETVRISLGEGGSGGKLDRWLLTIFTVLSLATGALPVLAGALGIELPNFVAENAWPILGSAFVPPVIAILIVALVLDRRRITREARWIAALPFPFAHEGYVEALRRAPERVELLVRLARSVERGSLEASWETAGVTGTLFWENPTRARISSPEFAARVEGSGGGQNYSMGYSTGGPMHAWFRRLTASLLVDLQRDYGLTAVELKC